MSGGGSQSQTTRVELSPQQKELFGLAMPWLRGFSRNPPTLPEGSGVAGFNPLQTKGQAGVLGSVGDMGQTVRSAAAGNRFLTSGDVLSPDSNPHLRGYMDAAARPIVDNLMENILPTVRGGAATTGNYGSTRQGVAEGISTGKALSQVGDVSSRIASEGYGQGLDAMTKGIGLSGQVAQNLALPGMAVSGVGDVRQNMEQRLLDDQRYRSMYPQLLPLMMGQQLASIASGMPTAGASTFASGGNQNIFGQILGGAASLGSLFGGGGPFGAAGAFGGSGGLTALLPFLSDRTQKTNIKHIGFALDGTKLYIYRYVMEPHKDVMGPMADELDSRFVYEKGGLKYIRAREWAMSMGEKDGAVTGRDDEPLHAAGAGPHDDGLAHAEQPGYHPDAHGFAGDSAPAGSAL